VALLLEELLDQLSADVGVGRAGVAASDHHAPNRFGCMGFVFVVSGVSHGK
jgi:hypothetical protein